MTITHPPELLPRAEGDVFAHPPGITVNDRYTVWSTAEGRLLVWPAPLSPAEFIALLAVPEFACGHC